MLLWDSSAINLLFFLVRPGYSGPNSLRYNHHWNFIYLGKENQGPPWARLEHLNSWVFLSGFSVVQENWRFCISRPGASKTRVLWNSKIIPGQFTVNCTCQCSLVYIICPIKLENTDVLLSLAVNYRLCTNLPVKTEIIYCGVSFNCNRDWRYRY